VSSAAAPWLERLLEAGLFGCALLSVATTAGIVGVLALETLAFFREVSLGQLLFDTQWTPLFHEKHFGLWPLLAGTCLTSGIALLVALPLGLLAAIYLSEFASPSAAALLEARTGAARWNSHHRLRLLRAGVCDSRATKAGAGPGRFQLARRRHRARHHADPDDLVSIRRRFVCGAKRAAGGSLCARRGALAHHLSRCVAGCHVRHRRVGDSGGVTRG
jgi:hypothetical protein